MEDITVYITSSLTSSERKISLNLSIENFQKKLELITGIPPNDQKIWIYPRMDSNERKELDLKVSKSLINVDLVPFGRIHVDNINPNSEIKELEDLIDKDRISNKNNNEDYDGKFELPELKYNQMSNTVLNYMKTNKIGKFDPNLKEKEIESINEIINRIKLGDRCRISNNRIGTISYIGKIPEIDENIWVGISLDFPLGKNDGSIKGKQYFKTNENHGVFVKPQNIEVGDFPLPDLEDDDEEL